MSVPNQRGSALLLVYVVVLVLALIGVGVIRFASREVAGATAGEKQQALASCAEAGRQLLLSQFHALGMEPTSLQAFNVQLDANTKAVGGHFDTDAPTSVQVAQVTYLPEQAFGPNRRVSGIGNRIGLWGGGGRPMKVVVHCQQGGDGTAASGRQLEVEFGVRFGL